MHQFIFTKYRLMVYKKWHNIKYKRYEKQEVLASHQKKSLACNHLALASVVMCLSSVHKNI